MAPSLITSDKRKINKYPAFKKLMYSIQIWKKVLKKIMLEEFPHIVVASSQTRQNQLQKSYFLVQRYEDVKTLPDGKHDLIRFSLLQIHMLVSSFLYKAKIIHVQHNIKYFFKSETYVERTLRTSNYSQFK